jgi:predicted neuraminidase
MRQFWAVSAAVLLPALWPQSAEPALKMGPVDLVTPEGVSIRMANYAERRATAVLFLSSRDPGSDAAIESLPTLYAKVRRQDTLFVAVFPNAAETGKEVRAYTQDRGLVFPVYRDPSGKIAKQFGAKVTPEAFLLDRDGAVRYQGAIDGLDQALADLGSNRSIRRTSATAPGTPIGKTGSALALRNQDSAIEFSSELIFETIPGFPAHHCSSIVEAPNGDLLVIWYGGSYESSDDQVLFLSRRKKSSRIWSKPEIVIRSPGQPPGNAVVFVDGLKRVWIVWGRMEGSRPMPRNTGWDACRLLYRTSKDNGVTWSDDKVFYQDTLGWLPRNVPISLTDGTFVLPLSDERNGTGTDRSFFLATKDNGATWTRSAIMAGGEQPTIIQRSDGSLLALLRTRPRILQSESQDLGKTWTPPQPTELKCPDAGISMRRLSNGHVLLAFNNNENSRTPLHVAMSLDEGRTWGQPLELESLPGEYSYPSVYQTADGKIHIIYTFRRQTIKHVELNENWFTGARRGN